MSNPSSNQSKMGSIRRTKSMEELNFELHESKEELDRSIRHYEESIRKMRRKDHAWTLVTLAILILVIVLVFSSIKGLRDLVEYPDRYRSLLWACLGSLLLGFMVARWLARWERRADFDEENLRRRREQAASQYAEFQRQIDELKAMKVQKENKNQNTAIT